VGRDHGIAGGDSVQQRLGKPFTLVVEYPGQRNRGIED